MVKYLKEVKVEGKIKNITQLVKNLFIKNKIRSFWKINWNHIDKEKDLPEELNRTAELKDLLIEELLLED